LKSKIINMAEKTSDAVDRMLTSAFESEPIADDGFSTRIVSRIRRRIWMNRLALPIAVLVGAAFALKPAVQLVSALLPLMSAVPVEVTGAPMQYLPQLQLVVLGGMAFAAGVTLIRFLEET
jgi:hypothetical protein